MAALTYLPLSTAGRAAAFAAFAFALVASGTNAAEISFAPGKIEARELKGIDFCKFMVLEDIWATKDHISGTWNISAARQLSSGKFDVVIKKGKVVTDMWGEGAERAIETTKLVGQDIHVKVALDYRSGLWGSEIGSCEVAFVLPDAIAQTNTAEGISKQLAEEKSRLAKLREEQRKESERLAKLKAGAARSLAEERSRRAKIEAQLQEAERLAKLQAEEETRLAKLREEQRKEADRLAKLKAEAEQRLAKGESLDANFESKLRDAERLAAQQSKEAARLAKLREEQGKESKRLLSLKAEAEQRLANEETRRAQLDKQTREAERLAKQLAEEETRLAGLREKQRKEADRLAKQRAKEEARLAGLREKQRKEADRLAKLRSEAEIKMKADEAGIGGELKQQLEFLKNLQEGGLINEQEFNSRKAALLNRFLGLNQSPPSNTPSAKTAKNLDAAKLNEFSDVKFGKYHALVIGNNEYKNLPDLKTAINDAKSVADILRDDYGYDVSLMTDASRDDILDSFDEYRETLGSSDNLLIYFAGHGWLDEDGNQGYWLPVDAKKNRRSNWISVASVTTTIRALDANHVMVVADSCFSGALVRGLKITEKRTDYIRRMVDKRARVVLTSGGLEPVADSDGSGHSPFAKAFIGALSKNKSVIDGTGLFTSLRRSVVLSADQTPEYGDIRKAGHEGGDFLFVKKK